MSTRLPSTFVVGAGPVAVALAGAMRKAGVPVLGLWARRADRARQAGAHAGVAAFSSAPPDLLMEAEVIVLAVRDAEIGNVASMLVGTGLVNKRHVLVHCAGAVSAEAAFAGVRHHVGGVAVVHPLRAIPDGRAGIDGFVGAAFGVEGDAPGLAIARALVTAVKGAELPLTGAKMAAYHAAAAISSNLVVALMDAAVATMVSAGVDENSARAALVPLAQGALANVAERGLVAGLTGPVKRGDASTVASHVAALREVPGVLPIYQQLSTRLLTLAGQGGLPAEARAAVTAALGRA